MRGERIALSSLEIGTADTSPGAPQVEMLQLVGLDEEGRIALQIWFDVEDMDAAVAELDVQHVRLADEQPIALANAASRVEERIDAMFADGHWDAIGELLVDNFRTDDRRRGLRRESNDRATELKNLRAMSAVCVTQISTVPIALRGERLCLARMRFDGLARFNAEAFVITEVNADGLVVVRIAFDVENLDAASRNSMPATSPARRHRMRESGDARWIRSARSTVTSRDRS